MPRRWLSRLLRYPLAVLALGILAAASLLARRDVEARRRRKARLIFGPVPIISIKYMSQAMARLGYEARTFVYSIYEINAREDFDYVLSDLFRSSGPGGPIRQALQSLVGPYVAFIWLLPRFDVFHHFFDGGFLSGTPLWRFEVQLLHLARKQVVMMPYGSDVAVPTHIRSLAFRQGMMMSYPVIGRREAQTLKRIDYFSRHADFIVACLFQMETMPRWDLLTLHYYPIDTDAWQTDRHASTFNGHDGPVTVVHSPNHRGLKGTEFLLAACRELQAEGYQLELRLLEGLPNTEVRRILEAADILAEQFIHGYGLNAMEGMSLGKPVLSNLADAAYYEVMRLYTGLDQCPIVNTPIGAIKDNLRMLVSDPDRRQRLGNDGRRFVQTYHSYAAVGAMWDQVYRKIWNGEQIELTAWNPGHATHEGSS